MELLTSVERDKVERSSLLSLSGSRKNIWLDSRLIFFS